MQYNVVQYDLINTITFIQFPISPYYILVEIKKITFHTVRKKIKIKIAIL